MKLLFLGTGAADWPLVKPAGNAEFRRLSSALIDDCFLIDPGPQVLESLQTHGKDTAAIQYILNTHPHSDHFNQDTLDTLTQHGAKFIAFYPSETKQVGPYTVTAVAGNHGTCQDTLHYIIEDPCGKRLFYGLDGAWLLYEEVAAIQKNGVDLAVLDATIGDVPGDYRIFEHNNLNMVLEIKQTLAPYVRRFAISHMARTLHTDHQTLAATMAAKGVEVAYDGWETTL